MRPLRLDLPGIPAHVMHRGVNRSRIFRDDEDRQRYLRVLAACSGELGIRLHGYALMDNHVHLLVTPEAIGSVAKLMQAIGRTYVRGFNHRWGRTGTLWEGRYRSCLVDNDRYFLACLAYIELNPVRAGMVSEPGEHAWTSASHHLGLRTDSFIASHPTLDALACDGPGRTAAWRAILQTPLLPETLEAIRSHTRRHLALGAASCRPDAASNRGG